MKTRVTELLGIEKPIIQGGMAWVAESHLAAAVSNAGGFGLIGAANAPADVVRNYIHEARELTDKPFGVNIMLMSPFAEDIAQLGGEDRSGYDRSRKPGEIYGAVESCRYQGDSGNCICSSRKTDGACGRRRSCCRGN